ncbi:MAG: 50S ribosomal protein L15 [Treponema sp.]|uniref:50S ribosomal protein L15 n=1 Tax=Treponema sp. TaxID=166 RepID=UPI00298DC7FA|nr:50S ribosomal protein L15 [Treponema sp.]MCI7441367.1 50S ribosomal protein L15 [Spirochaetia bacterium]MDD7580216.1 50S ribosomal protein L15 [Treponema sp.]MDY3758029.1 50S ribosomal protein L15 [Treponema sp.]MDY4131174.1 50S ribosomal protein L15 [Treponema sp.]MDY5837622.1 50S ribosomal protein L15 [Treponema sp.]
MADFTLTAPQGANKKPKRVGRGSSSGLGSTAGKGNKGQQSRSGKAGPYVGFEGGQMPLYRRIAHRGFSNYPFKKEYVCINLVELEAKFADGETVNKDTLKAKGMVGKVVDGIKILGNGDLTKKLTVEVSKVSASAKAKIEKAGGSVKVLADSEKKSAE